MNFSGPASTVDGPNGFHSVTNFENWQLIKDSVDISGEISQIGYADNRDDLAAPRVARRRVSTRGAGLIDGADGEALDGDSDGNAGGNFSTDFEVGPLQLRGAETIVGQGLIAKAASNPDGSFVFVWTVVSTVKAQGYDVQGLPVGAVVDARVTYSSTILDVEADNQGHFTVLRRRWPAAW